VTPLVGIDRKHLGLYAVLLQPLRHYDSFRQASVLILAYPRRRIRWRSGTSRYKES
jgi:hypothetical protein